MTDIHYRVVVTQVRRETPHETERRRRSSGFHAGSSDQEWVTLETLDVVVTPRQWQEIRLAAIYGFRPVWEGELVGDPLECERVEDTLDAD